MTIKKIQLGYWYQRTTLHLSEVYDFLVDGKSPLDLDAQKLKNLRKKLQLKSIHMQISYFEYILIEAENGITVKLYEDGLVVFENDATKDIVHDLEELHDYFEDRLSPALSYLFSLGAPVPKELANIKTISPYFIVATGVTSKSVSTLFKKLHVREYYQIESHGAQIYRGSNIYLINTSKNFKHVDELIEMQIFFKEFKSQLHRYLNMHRIIWEQIAEVKEQGMIRGKDVGDLRNHLESYKKTIELIDGRIAQMGTHIKTREEIIGTLKWEQLLTDVLEFKYATLSNTLDYIKSLWGMTKNYVDSAISLFGEIESKSTKDSVKALTLVTTIGVAAGIMRFLQVSELPQISRAGLIYFGLVLVATWFANRLVSAFYKNKRYEIKDIKAERKV